MNTTTGTELDGKASFSSTVPELAKLFDGTEELVVILDIPFHSRETYLP